MIEWLLATFGLLAAAVVVSEILLLFINVAIRPLISKTKTTLDDRLIDAIQTPIRILGFALGSYLTLKAIDADMRIFSRNLDFWFGTALIFWAGILVSKLTSAVIRWYYRELSAEAKQKTKIAISDDLIPMLGKLANVAIYSITFTILLNRFGVEITPIITALGIGGLAVALALKDTLSNFFAGIYLLSDKPIKRGEFIALDNENSVIKGFVEEVGWRMTRIRTRGNYRYYIPNEKITLSNIVNFSRGSDNNWKGASIEVSAEYGSDIRKVKSVLLEAVRKVQKKDSRISREAEPGVRLNDLGDSGYVFKVMFRVNNHFESDDVCGEIREQIAQDFGKNGIAMPFKTQTILIRKQESE